jgi:uncharacterized protein
MEKRSRAASPCSCTSKKTSSVDSSERAAIESISRLGKKHMPHSFGSLAFTPAVKALQERYGSRRQYARFEGSESSPARLSLQESEFIGERDTFYMATLGSTGWPYVQHRGGPKGFLKVIDERTIAFADFRGNKQ